MPPRLKLRCVAVFPSSMGQPQQRSHKLMKPAAAAQPDAGLMAAGV